MKTLNSYITEKILINKNTQINKNDPYSWHIDDIIYIVKSHIPTFYQIVNKTPKGFIVKELKEKIVKGTYNSPSGYTVIADKNDFASMKTLRASITSDNKVKIRASYAYYFDGTPIHGYLGYD